MAQNAQYKHIYKGNQELVAIDKTYTPTTNLFNFIGTKFNTVTYSTYNTDTYSSSGPYIVTMNYRTGTGATPLVRLSLGSSLIDGTTDINGSMQSNDIGELRWGFENWDDFFVSDGVRVPYTFLCNVSSITLTGYAPSVGHTVQFRLYGYNPNGDPELVGVSQSVSVGTPTGQVMNLQINSSNKWYTGYGLRAISSNPNNIAFQQLAVFGALKTLKYNF